VGQLRHSAWFNVTGPPVVRPMPNVSAIAGQSLSLMCPVGGWPIEQISWFQSEFSCKNWQFLQILAKIRPNFGRFDRDLVEKCNRIARKLQKLHQLQS